MAHVPYRGAGPALTDIVAGHVDMMFDTIVTSLPLHRAGSARIVAIANAQRSSALPDVPTIAESGLPGFEATAWYGLLAPGATPRAVVEKLNAEIVRILKQPDVAQRLRGEAFDLPAETPDQFAAVIRAELAKWEPIVRQAGIKPE